ncbi:SDR family NAD(P)-dependent oxidoreductase [bacterium]|nr:SDR family NAD(P)-dependent oxidoreductase [bacterium]
MKTIFDIRQKIALVTGSSQGIGLTLAKGLAENGAITILNGRQADKLTQAADRIQIQGYQIHTSAFDVSDDNQVSAAVQTIEDKIGPIDILVNNAGINIRNPLEAYDNTDWDQLMNTNLKGAYLVSKHVAQYMIMRKRGKIINICSMQSELGRKTITPYAASKGGLKMLTKGMAVEWGQYHIQVNGIGPGYFRTDMTKPLWTNPDFDTWLRNRTPAHRWGEPEELTGPLIFLASSASDYVNGHILYVDGGLLASI